MNEPFVIPVFYKNETKEFEAQLFTSAYTYRIQVMVDDVAIYFERDDEEGFRALAATPGDKKMQHIDFLLLSENANAIEKILS